MAEIWRLEYPGSIRMGPCRARAQALETLLARTSKESPFSVVTKRRDEIPWRLRLYGLPYSFWRPSMLVQTYDTIRTMQVLQLA
ncbi:MAG: hypothetical protein KGJ74_15135, partial [Betaproteobacteria bacterium]|nr:hypothetical protein [Betaproteobacteria bacterium]